MIEVDADVLDLGRRLREGDELWRGDPTMSLQINMGVVPPVYEVWALDGTGTPYIAWTGSDCTPRMLIELAEWDWHQGSRSIVDRLARQAQRDAATEAARTEDITAAFADKVGWTLMRVLNGRRQWSIGRKVGA